MHACICGQESNTRKTTLKGILKKETKQMLLKCNFGPESETTYAESVGLSKLILYKVPFQFSSLFSTVLQC